MERWDSCSGPVFYDDDDDDDNDFLFIILLNFLPTTYIFFKMKYDGYVWYDEKLSSFVSEGDKYFNLACRLNADYV